MKILHSRFAVLILAEILLIPLIVKIIGMKSVFLQHQAYDYNTMFQVVAHDSILYFFILLFIYLSYQTFINRLFSIFFRIMALSIYLLYIMDIFVLKSFKIHLVLRDVASYITYGPDYISQTYGFNVFMILGFVLFIAALLFFLFKEYEVKEKKQHVSYIVLLMLCFNISLFANNGTYVKSWIFKNVIEYNFEVLEKSKDYSKDFKTNFTYNEEKICLPSVQNKKNIIILMVESLGSYQSQHFSQIKNWTPNLDRIAKENISFNDFHANAYMTEDAQVAMLTGLFPIYAPNRFLTKGSSAYVGFYGIKDSLPNILKKQGYQTEYITSADLEFSNTEKWVKSIGFDYIEGSTHEYYDDKERFMFKAAADEYLYDRVLTRMKKQTKNYFFFIKTVNSHPPFINPKTNKYDEEGTIRYVDQEIGNFYDELIKSNFFDNGMLLIVGDHRPMVTLKPQEIEKHGTTKAAAMVPLIVSFGGERKELVKVPFHQADIHNSLKNYVTEQSCTSDWKGDFLSENKKSPKYMPHTRGDQRNIINVFTQDDVFYVRLNGDDTEIIEKEESKIVNKINYERLQRQKSLL